LLWLLSASRGGAACHSSLEAEGQAVLFTQRRLDSDPRAELRGYPMTLAQRIESMFAPRPGESIHILASEGGQGGTYALAMISDARSAARFLVFVPKTGPSTVLTADPVLDELTSLGVPVETADALRAQVAEPEQATEPSEEPTRPAPTTQDQANQAITDEASRNAGVLATNRAPDTSGGLLACAWAVNKVVRDATGRSVDSDGGVSTIRMFDALRKGRGTPVRADQPVPAGAIVISPTQGTAHGHVGIVGEGELIYSNSSTLKRWEQNFTITSWKQEYGGKKLEVLFFTVNP
jgi:hypothetical protein